jgi:predicted transcriptional regulator of viral defense system
MTQEVEFKMSDEKIMTALSGSGVYSLSDLQNLFRLKRGEWSLSSFSAFVKKLKSLGLVERNLIDSNGVQRKKLFTMDDFDHLECAGRFFNNSYLSHHTALFFNDLTEQIPKTIYVSYELSPVAGVKKGDLVQSGIDVSFSKPGREPEIFSFASRSVVIHASKFSGLTGVIKHGSGKFSFTDVERTLIDSAVNPNLSGGIYNVLNIFQQGRGVYSVDKLLEYLIKLNYTYPYHQVLGFLLERSGAPEEQLSLFEKIGVRYRFYLDREITEPVLSKRWNLIYPGDFDR